MKTFSQLITVLAIAVCVELASEMYFSGSSIDLIQFLFMIGLLCKSLSK